MFSAFVPATGTSWTLVGPETLAMMAATLHGGLPATSHCNVELPVTRDHDGTLASATIDNVAAIGR